MVLTATAVATVRQAVRTGLAYEGGATSASWHPPSGVRPQELVEAVRRHRVLQLLSANRSGINLPLEFWAALEPLRRAEALRSVLQVEQLHRAVEVLQGADVPVLSFKGPALAMITTGDVAARGHGDIDLFVPPDRLADAFRALGGAGWRHAVELPEPTSWAWNYLIDSTYESTMVSTHSRIDLHWRLEDSRQGLPTFSECWAQRREVELLGRRIQTLGQHHTLTHSCVHAAKDQWAWLRSLADIHRLMRDTTGYEPDHHLRPCDRQTPSVVSHCIGLPSSWRSRLPSASAATLDKARRAQDTQPLKGTARRPGVAWASSVRRRASGTRSPSEWGWAVSAVVLPAASFAGQTTKRRRSALTSAAVHRVFGATQRALDYAAATTPR